MAKRITIKDIAKELDINSSTVSRALNDSPLISDQKKKLIKEKATEMGYSPNTLARQLREGSSRTIGLVVPIINRVFFANVIHGVERVTRSRGYQLIICQSNNSVEEETAALHAFREQKVAGVLLSQADSWIEPEPLQRLMDDGISIVMFDRVSNEIPVSKVVNANRDGSYQAVKHLLDQGYRKILHFGGSLELNIYRERFEGYKLALEEFGLAVDPSLVFRPVLTQEEGRSTMVQILKEGLKFDAIAATSDFSCLGAWQVLQEAGIRIPEEKGLIGFANESFTELIGMSSVDQFSVDMGRSAAELLLEEIKSEADLPLQEQRERVIVPKLVLRDSSIRKGK